MSDLAPNLSLPEADKKDFVKIDPLSIRVLDCRVLVEKIDAGNVTAGGILLPQGADEKRQLRLMRVVSVGDGRTTEHGVHIDVRVKPGDYVVVGKFAGHEIGHGDNYKIINEVEIFGVQEVE